MTLKIYVIQIISRNALGFDIKLNGYTLLGTEYITEKSNSNCWNAVLKTGLQNLYKIF
jgi:hypothetical protein